jgi:transposase InsO family protein
MPMPCKECPVVSQRADLAQEMIRRSRPVREIAAKYGLCRTTAYKWQNRFRAGGRDAVQNASRRPHRSPAKTPDPIEELMCAMRQARSSWGPDKIHRFLVEHLVCGVPPPRTIARILKRRGHIEAKQPPSEELTRFEHATPNELWQIDFKQTVRLRRHPPLKAIPMAILDDHSRFTITLCANPDRQLDTVWPVLWHAMSEYGMPVCILTDNDPVFRGRHGGLTAWTARLLRLGIKHSSGRPYHPQTQGKVERFYGTVQTDVLADGVFRSLQQLQAAFDEFRDLYNHQRPHAALHLDVPADHYRPSPRTRPDHIPPAQYPDGAQLRKVMNNGAISVRNCRVHIGEGIAGEYVRLHDCDPWLQIEYAGHITRRVRWDELRRDRWI